MEFDNIFLFINLVNSGGYEQCAKALQMSSSTVSRRINDLEQTLNVNLIKRNAHSFNITDAGKDFYDKFKHYYEDYTSNLNDFLQSSDELIGTLKISLPAVIAKSFIMPYVGQFYAKYPKVSLLFTYSSAQVSLLNDGFDIAISRSLPRATNSYNIKALKTFYTKLYATPEYIASYGYPHTLDDLLSHSIVGIADEYQARQSYLVKNLTTNEEEIFEYKPQIAINNRMQSLELAYSHNLITMSLDIVVQKEVLAGKLVPILPDYAFHEWDIYLITNKNQSGKLYEEFTSFLETCFQGE
jgi:DNA-binding transcriptional LysR family regulator